MEIPGGLSTRLGQRTGCVRPQGMVHVFDAERVEIKYFSKECETGSRGLEPFFESGWWHQIVNHDVPHHAVGGTRSGLFRKICGPEWAPKEHVIPFSGPIWPFFGVRGPETK